MKGEFTHLSLFTGIGGIDLAAEWAGFQTVGQVEQNGYANRVLRSRFGRTIPRWTDIKDLTADDFRRRTGIDSPTLISGGFPCQPFSCAGKRRGKEDDRHLWPEMFRVVRELRPAWVLGENVAGIISMELDGCLTDLESIGYTFRPFNIPACAVGALHRRARVFIVANTEHNGRAAIQEPERLDRGSNHREKGQICPWEPDTCVPNPHSPGLSCSRIAREEGSKDGREIPTPSGSGWWDVEPAVGRVAHGVPHRVDRLRCLGNAVVPQQVYPILAGIAQVEQEVMI